MNKVFKKFWANDDGNIGAMAAISGSVLLAASALTIETQSIYSSQASLQSALDAATLAAASADRELQTSVAREVFDLAVGSTSIDFGADGVAIAREGEFLVGTATGTVDALLGGVLTPATVTVSARSVVGFNRELGGADSGDPSEENLVEEAGTRACIIILDSGNRTLIMNSNAAIEAPNCELHIHATGNNPVSYDANANVSKICLAGDSFSQNNNFERNNPHIDPVSRETNCDVAQDPYAGTLPSTDDINCVSQPRNINGNQPQTFTPGRYCQGINVNGNADIHFEPGVYVITRGWNINGGAWTGDGVTFVFENQGNFQYNSQFGGMNMSAPTSGEYANLFMVDEDGSRNFILNSNNELNIRGSIYMPERKVIYNSNSTTIGSEMNFIVGSMTINSNASLNIESANFMPQVPGETYDLVPASDETLVASNGSGNGIGDGVGDDEGLGSDNEMVSTSEAVPFLVE